MSSDDEVKQGKQSSYTPKVLEYGSMEKKTWLPLEQMMAVM